MSTQKRATKPTYPEAASLVFQSRAILDAYSKVSDWIEEWLALGADDAHALAASISNRHHDRDSWLVSDRRRLARMSCMQLALFDLRATAVVASAAQQNLQP